MVKGPEIQIQSKHKVVSTKLVHQKHSFPAQGLS